MPSESIQTHLLFPHFVTLQLYSKIDNIFFFPSQIYTQYTIITKLKQVFRDFRKFMIFFISHLRKYSDPLLSTLLKLIWQRLQPRVFLGMMLQAWHTCIWRVSPILLCRSSQALSGWMGSVAALSSGQSATSVHFLLCDQRATPFG